MLYRFSSRPLTSITLAPLFTGPQQDLTQPSPDAPAAAAADDDDACRVDGGGYNTYSRYSRYSRDST